MLLIKLTVFSFLFFVNLNVFNVIFLYDSAQDKQKSDREEERNRGTTQILQALQQTVSSNQDSNKNLNELVANLARNQAILVAQAQMGGQQERFIKHIIENAFNLIIGF